MDFNILSTTQDHFSLKRLRRGFHTNVRKKEDAVARISLSFVLKLNGGQHFFFFFTEIQFSD